LHHLPLLLLLLLLGQPHRWRHGQIIWQPPLLLPLLRQQHQQLLVDLQQRPCITASMQQQLVQAGHRQQQLLLCGTLLARELAAVP
jgi:hypothetical protein